MKLHPSLYVAVAVAALAGVSYAAGKSQEVSINAADIKWGPMIPNLPNGPQIAVVWGDPSKGANGFLLKLPPDYNSGWHTHSNDYRAVVIKGVMSNSSAGESKPTDLPVGSYYSTPGKLAHNNHCLPGSECIVYIHYDKKMDYQPSPAPKG